MAKINKSSSSVCKIPDGNESKKSDIDTSGMNPTTDFQGSNGILDLIAQGVRIIDKDYNVQFINRAFVEISGVSREQAIGMKCWEVFSSPFCHNPNCRLEKVLNGQETVRGEVTRTKRDGTIVPCSVFTVALRSQNGELVGIMESFNDITQYEKVKEQALEAQALYRTLIELGTKAGEAIVMLQDIQGREAVQTFVSDKWLDITGYSNEELIGSTFLDLIKESDRASSLERHRRKMAGESIPGLFEMVIIRKDGSEVPIEITGASTFYQGVRANVIYIRNILNRKELEERLGTSEKFYRTLFNNTGTATFILDDQGTIMLVNHEWTNLFGYSKEEIERTASYLITVPEGLREKTSRYFKERTLVPNSLPTTYETQVITKSGSVKDVMLTVSMIPATSIRLISMTDVSERKRLTQELNILNEHLKSLIDQATGKLQLANHQLQNIIEEHQETEKTLAGSLLNERTLRSTLESQMAQRVEFTRALVHELRTPLTAVLAASDLLIDVSESELSRKLSKQINKGSLDLNKRINELFDLARGEIGMISIRKNPISLDKILTGVISFFTPEAQKKQISLIPDWTPQVGEAWGDHQRITQVLNNLMVNALKYTGENGKITLRARQLADSCLIEVEDNGCGIAPKLLPELFKAYNRASGSSEGPGGMCLGLALCKMLVELHSGKIWIRSQERTGTCVCFTLPSEKNKKGQAIL